MRGSRSSSSWGRGGFAVVTGRASTGSCTLGPSPRRKPLALALADAVDFVLRNADVAQQSLIHVGRRQWVARPSSLFPSITGVPITAEQRVLRRRALIDQVVSRRIVATGHTAIDDRARRGTPLGGSLLAYDQYETGGRRYWRTSSICCSVKPRSLRRASL
jgi:hypothetical protein